ncbi:hypothetical protein M378DRAFT_739248 [Amanita muscaria Koide BX008]|uniref:Uncharacterized protein n=1 Tax=Amanita muscaria (strain Koide BX008) TaxID=946122 RepID=A0A0C2WMR7_AMAMK|nr:hypothetical protein M378DRAFT_739248 [Amanita muscaria Koide BX008]
MDVVEDSGGEECARSGFHCAHTIAGKPPSHPSRLPSRALRRLADRNGTQRDLQDLCSIQLLKTCCPSHTSQQICTQQLSQLTVPLSSILETLSVLTRQTCHIHSSSVSPDYNTYYTTIHICLPYR